LGDFGAGESVAKEARPYYPTCLRFRSFGAGFSATAFRLPVQWADRAWLPVGLYGAPGRIRTLNPEPRTLLLYPIELQALIQRLALRVDVLRAIVLYVRLLDIYAG